ncbi:hypothetical protein R6Z07F_000996 [Ovis aries]
MRQQNPIQQGVGRGRAARERKREASEIPEWIDRCYVIGAASSTPQEARSRRKRQASGRGHRASAPPPRSRSGASEKRQPRLFLVSSSAEAEIPAGASTPAPAEPWHLEPRAMAFRGRERAGRTARESTDGHTGLDFSPGVNGCSTTLLPSFRHKSTRTVSSTTDSSQAMNEEPS